MFQHHINKCQPNHEAELMAHVFWYLPFATHPSHHTRMYQVMQEVDMHEHCRWDKNSVSSLPLEPCFDVPNNSPNHLLNSLFLCLEKLAKKSSNQTTHLFSCQNSL